MGQESIQIRQHIEDERAQLDANLDQLERTFIETKETLLRWWKTPTLLVGLALTVGFITVEYIVRRTQSR